MPDSQFCYADNCPRMIHAPYKGLLTKAEGEGWFAMAPACAANVILLPAVSRKRTRIVRQRRLTMVT